MIEHIENIRNIYGNAYVQIPNDIFRNISSGKDSDKSNINQISFAYCYVLVISFLYKYAHFVDFENNTYIQNSNIKEMLGYGKTTKSIDSVIKRNGLLDSKGITETIKNFPIGVNYIDDTINEMRMREFVYIEDIKGTDEYKKIKEIVKNRNYEIKEPVFFFENNDDVGTLFEYSNTHRIDIDEFLYLLKSKDLDNIDTLLYFFFKYKCYGRKGDVYSISLSRITNEIGVSKDCFYRHFEKLEKRSIVTSKRKSWHPKSEDFEANEYIFKGI